jgi:enhancing lycopene biosynthesis protein 2
MKNIAVILSGCGFLDGAEIREAVLALLYIEQNNGNVSIFAPDINQRHVVDHLSGKETNEKRNVLVEAARIARGNVQSLSALHASDFDALIIPGGFGVAKNISNLAVKGAEATVIEEFVQIVSEFIKQQKPIGAICIAPAVLTAALTNVAKITVTIGDDNDGLIENLGGTHANCATEDIIIDNENNIISCSAYMREDTISNVATGIEKLVKKTIEMA